MSHKKPPIINICKFCRKEFISKQHHTLIQKFCSYNCVGKSKVGIKRIIKKVKNSAQFKIGHKPTNGFKLGQTKGEKHPNWKGGKDTLSYRHRVWDMKRRALGTINLKIVQMLYEENIKKYSTLTCYLCLKNIEFGQDNIEHKIPVSRGGTNEYENLAVACWDCNRKKRAKTLEEYMEVQNGK